MPVSCASSWRGPHSEKEQMEKPRVCSSSRGVSREVRISCQAAHGGPLPTLLIIGAPRDCCQARETVS